MRQTIRPVTLTRIIETADIYNKHNISNIEEIQEILDLSENRTKEITNEMQRTSLIETEKQTLTQQGKNLLSACKNEDWKKIHKILYRNSPHYSVFIDYLDGYDGKYGCEKEKIIDGLNKENENLRFNDTGISIVLDWAERLDIVQKNVFEDRYYTIDESREFGFKDIVQEEYNSIEVRTGNLKQRYVSIPRLREQVCERIGITRDCFDELLKDLYMDNIGGMELSGAPLDTKAKQSKLGIKSIGKTEEGGVVSSVMSSERVLDGVSLENNKMYYYIAIFEKLK